MFSFLSTQFLYTVPSKLAPHPLQISSLNWQLGYMSTSYIVPPNEQPLSDVVCDRNSGSHFKSMKQVAWSFLVLSWIFVHGLNNCSVQFSHSVVSDSLRPHELQHARPPCPSPTPGVDSNSRPSSRWCHPIISSSVVPFSCPQSFPASGSFQMSQLFSSSGQSIGVSALTSVLPMNIQDWSPLGWTGWISLQAKDLSRVFSKTTV